MSSARRDRACLPSQHQGLFCLAKSASLKTAAACLALSLTLLAGGNLQGASAAGYLDGLIEELVLLNFAGRAAESFEQVGSLLVSDPGDYRAYFIRATCYGWFIATDPDNRRYDNQIGESLKACIKYAEKIKPGNPDYERAMFFRAMALITDAGLSSLRGNDIASRWKTRKAEDAADELVGKFPDHLDATLPLAAFNYYWGGSSFLKRSVQFTLLLPRANKEQGLKMLYALAEKGEDTNLWARLVLLMVFRQQEGAEKQALEIVRQFNRQFPNNVVFQLQLADSYCKLGQWSLAESVYRGISAKVLSGYPGYDEVVFEISRLYIVEAQIEQNKIEEAFAGVKAILISNPLNPEWIVPWAHLYTARIYARQEKWERAERACRYSLDANDYNQLHQAAKNELKLIEKMAQQ